MIDRRPALIACCHGVADVINCVNFARTNELLVAVRGGGHNVAGSAVCDGGLMIDLSGMKSVRVDPERRTARAEPGVTWGDFDRETQAFGLATTGGQISTTGVAGLTLGGGWGHLARRYGLVCDNLISADLATADGSFLTVSATQHADLFWGLRGGGGNFGVVTSLEYRLHPVGAVMGGIVAYPLEKAKEVLRLFRDFTAKAPDELASQNYWKSSFLKEISDEAIDTMVSFCANRPSPMCHGLIEHQLGGAVSRVDAATRRRVPRQPARLSPKSSCGYQPSADTLTRLAALGILSRGAGEGPRRIQLKSPSPASRERRGTKPLPS